MDVPLDPIALEIITEGLVSIVREMRQTVIRTAHSPVISEAQDFSCALFNAKGEMVAQSRDMPGHVIAMPASVEEAMKDFGSSLAAGDVLVLNDPYRGGSHLNDVTVIYPVFVDGAPFVFPCVRMHWADIGGMTPGSISGRSTEIFQEGVRIPPIKLIAAGVENHAAMTLLFANVRSPEQRRGDLDACIAATRTAERRLQEFAMRYQAEEISRYLDGHLDRTEQRLRTRISTLPDGTYHYEDYLDLYSNGRYDPVLVRCALTIAGDEVSADFTGSSAQVDAVVNASRAMTMAGVFITIKSVLDPKGMINAGAFRPITLHVPTASVVDVSYPAPANAHSEVRKRVISAVMGALAQVAPDAVTADQCGSTFQNLLGGIDEKSGAPFLYYDYPPGGNGGFPESDGPDVMNPVDLGDISTVQPVETLETTCPVLVESCEYRTDSCGDGWRRGGLGARRRTRLLAREGFYSVQADRFVVPPYGLMGGRSGACANTFVEREGRYVEFATPGKVSGERMKAGDVLVMESAGGGGWGDPLDREAERVSHDIKSGLITEEKARTVYGVVLDAQAQVDVDATNTARSLLAGQRTRLACQVLPEPDGFGGQRGKHRRIRIAPSVAAGLAAGPGALLEIVGSSPGPLRAWADVGEDEDGGIAIGADGLAMLGVQEGARVEVRVLPMGFEIA